MFTPSFPIQMPFSLLCVVTQAQTSSAVLNRSDERGYPFLVNGFKEKVFSLFSFTIKYGVSWAFFFFLIGAAYQVWRFLFPLSVIIKKEWWILSIFFMFVEMIMWLLSFILLIWYVTLILFLNQPCIPGITSPWSWCIIHFVCCWIWFASNFLMICLYS